MRQSPVSCGGELPQLLWKTLISLSLLKDDFTKCDILGFQVFFFFSFFPLALCIFLPIVVKSCLTLVTPWTVTCQAPQSVGFSRQEYWSGLPFPSPGSPLNISSQFLLAYLVSPEKSLKTLWGLLCFIFLAAFKILSHCL